MLSWPSPDMALLTSGIEALHKLLMGAEQLRVGTVPPAGFGVFDGESCGILLVWRWVFDEFYPKKLRTPVNTILKAGFRENPQVTMTLQAERWE